MAMPKGEFLVFRYQLEWIPEGLRERLATNSFAKEDVGIAYLDPQSPGLEPVAVPCRLGTIVESRLSAGVIYIEICLGDFWIATDIDGFSRGLRSKAESFPRWRGTTLDGDFVHQIDVMPSVSSRSGDIAQWQVAVTQLKARIGFLEHPFFYHVIGIFKIRTKAPLRAKDGSVELLPYVTYEIRIACFIPGGSPDPFSGRAHPFWLHIESEDKTLSFATTTNLSIDSPYDEKIVRFRTSSVPATIDCALTIFSQRSPLDRPDRTKATLDFDLSTRTVANTRTLILQGLLIGAFLSIQGIYSIWINPQIADKLGSAVVLLVAGLIAGLIASFGLKKL